MYVSVWCVCLINVEAHGNSLSHSDSQGAHHGPEIAYRDNNLIGPQINCSICLPPPIILYFNSPFLSASFSLCFLFYLFLWSGPLPVFGNQDIGNQVVGNQDIGNQDVGYHDPTVVLCVLRAGSLFR